MDQDREHLRLLSLFHYICGGLMGLFACLPIIHLVLGLAVVNGDFPMPQIQVQQGNHAVGQRVDSPDADQQPGLAPPVFGQIPFPQGFPQPHFPQDKLPRVFGWLFVIFAGTLIVLGWSLAITMLLVGRSLKRRTNYTFCIVVAAVECLWVPIGTMLGVFTLVVLLRPSVKEMFTAPSAEIL